MRRDDGFGNRPSNEGYRQPSSSNTVSIDYHHLESSNKELGRPSRTMLGFFCERLLAKGKTVSLSDDMIHTWRLAGHNEETLFGMIKKNRLSSRTQLRLYLLQELSKVPAASLPVSVEMSELLDNTVDYFIPENNEKANEAPKVQPKSRLNDVPNIDHQALEKLKKLSAMMDLQAGSPGSQDRKRFDNHAEGMDPLRAFIVEKMDALAPKFSISKTYVEQMSRTIIKVLAGSGFSLDAMKRHIFANGAMSLGELMTSKIRLYETHLPRGVSAKFIISLVLDYLEECCK